MKRQVFVTLVVAAALGMNLPSAWGSQTLNMESLRTEVTALEMQNRLPDAINRVRSAHAELPDGATPERVELSTRLADLLSSAGRAREGFPYAESAWQSAQQLFAVDDDRTIQALAAYLDACPAVGKIKECAPIAAEAKQQWETAKARRKSGANADLLRAIALVENFGGRALVATKTLDDALALWSQAPIVNLAKIIRARQGKAVLLGNLGQERAALAETEAVVAALQSSGKIDQDEYFGALTTLSSQLVGLGRTAEAVGAARHAYERRRALFGQVSSKTVMSMDALATSLFSAGNTVEGLRLAADAKDYRQRLSDANSLEAIHARYRYADLLRQAGMYDEAVESLRAVVADFEKHHGDRHPSFATFAHALGRSYFALRQHERAAATFQESIRLFVALRGEDHPQTLLARVENFRNRMALGLPVPSTDVSALVERLKLKVAATHTYVQQGEMLLAQALSNEGADQKARDLLEQIVGLRRAQWGPIHRETLFARGQLLVSLLKLPTPDAVLEQHFLDYQRDLESLRLQYVVLGPGAQRETLDGVLQPINDFIVWRAKLGKVHGAFALAEQIKGRTARDYQRFHWRAVDGEAREVAMRIASLEAALANSNSRDTRESLITVLSAARSRLVELLPQPQDEVGAAAIQLASIADGTAFVHYVISSDKRVYALTATRRGDSNWYDLGAIRWPKQTVQALLDWIASDGQRFATTPKGERLRIFRVRVGSETYWSSSTEVPACATDRERTNAHCNNSDEVREVWGDNDFSEMRQHIGKQLLVPVVAALPGVKQLVISADRALSMLPWDALILADDQPAAAHIAISTAASLTAYQAGLRLHQRSGHMRDYLGIAAGTTTLSDNAPKEALAFAAAEVEGSAAHFRREKAHLLSERHASETTLRNLADSGELAQYRFVHIAAHARFDERERVRNAIFLGRQGDAARDDGIITLADWATFDLRAELVVLSACETALGRVVAGEGVIGFGHALKAEGVENVIATLWKVGDRASARFVVRLFAKLSKGVSPSEALAETKREFIRSTDPSLRSPRTWAAYTLYQ